MPDPTQTQPGPIKMALSSYFKTLIDNVSGPPPSNGEADLTNFSTPQQAVSDNAKINDLATIAIQHPALANVPKEHKNGFKQFLIALAQGGGDAGLTYAGLPTDYEKSQNAIKNRAISAQADESEASAALKGQQLQGMKTSVPVTMANGTTIMLPQALALKILNTQETNAGKTDVQGLKNEGGLDIQGSKNQGATDVAAIRASAMRDVAIGRNQAITEAARTRAWGTVKAAQLRASASGGTDPEDYMDAVSNGMPVNMIPMRVRGQVIAMASRNGIPVSFQKMGPAAQRANDAVNEMMPAATQLKSSLEKYKDQNGLMDRAKAA
jgi:hypothetical protein